LIILAESGWESAAAPGAGARAGAGAALASAAEAAAREPTEHGAERRQLTMLLCELVGSTELPARLDPEDVALVIRADQGATTEVIRRWGGGVAKCLDESCTYMDE
jgi:class 3 adenylate cyclase